MQHMAPGTEMIAANPPPARETGEFNPLDLEMLLAAGRRQFKLVLLCVLVALAVGLLYLLAAAPVYTARAKVIVDPGNTQVVGERDQRLTELGLDAGLVESQVELILSEEVLKSAADKLQLADDPSFAAGEGSLLRRLRIAASGLLDFLRGPSGPAVDQDYLRQRQIIGTLQKHLSVERVGQTYILQLSYSAGSPETAARVVNGIADAYISDQLQARFQAAQRTGQWMEQRIGALKDKSLKTDLAVQQYRAEHGLITADGQLVGDQRLAELNSQLMLAGVERAKAQARYDRIRSIIDEGDMGAAVSESLNSSLVNDLREKYLDAAKRGSELEGRLGAGHQRVVALHEEMAQYQKQIFGELGRIAESYKSDLQVAERREAALQDNLDSLVGTAAKNNQTMVGLRELEREAQTTRLLYESFLQRYQQVIQQQSFPMAEARIVTEAVPPLKPGGPRKSLILMAFVMAGGIAGVGFGALREFREDSFRSGEQIIRELGQEYIGTLPIVHEKVDAPPASGAREIATVQRSPRLIAEDGTIMRHVLDEPMSFYSETLRSAKVAADLMLMERKPKIIGIVSAMPSEGKSTVAKNFGSLLAQHGMRTLLVDGDLRNPDLTRRLAPNADAGLLDALEHGVPLKDLYLMEADSKLVVLPAVVRNRISHSGLLLSSVRMREVLQDAGQFFDYIVVDLPPLMPLADVRAAAHLFDGFLMVVEWGRTPRKLVRTTLAREPAVREKCLGVVLNKVNMRRQHLYEAYGAQTYYAAHHYMAGNGQSPA
ncbi:MAG: Wzz/FepE/Etk N-terminal domain-containing protein [Flavobacteriaceae bacterium]